MTEVVTSSAAIQQLNLLAPRQQVFVVERQGVDAGFATADTAPAKTDTAADTFAQFQSSGGDQNPVNHHDQAQPQARSAPAQISVSGPSKPRIEIKHIDLGLTPSEVVGTPDILQRFDTNGDGRVDLGEAARAGLAREGVFTFAGLAGGPQQELVDEPAPVLSSVAPSVVLPSDTTVTDSTPNAPKKLFTEADLAGVTPGKKIFTAAAAEGAPTGTVDVPKKFYGEGAEVVVGKFAAAETTPKFVEKVTVKPQLVTTDGETKLYDKVPQVETDQAPQGDQQPSGNGGQTAAEDKPKLVPAETKKTVLVEVAAYADASVITTTAEADATATVVTA